MHLVDITMFYAAEGGGVSTYLNAKARWLAQRSRIRHSIISPNVHSHNEAAGLIAIPAFSLPGINGYRMPRSVRAATGVLRRLEPDLIEVGDAGPCAWAALRMKRRCDTPLVAFYHSDLPRLMTRRFGRFALRGTRRYLSSLYSEFDMVLAPSRLMVDQLTDMGIQHAIHQPLGIDLAVFNPQRRINTLREHLQLPPNTRLLVYAGRFTAEKKLTVLIEAVRKLGRPYHLVLIGSGDPLPRFPQISYLPFKRDQRVLARLLASCDVLVHPGDYETFGLIVLEAMACGLPVIATTGGGVGELVNEHSGLLVQPNDVDALCGAIEAIFTQDLALLGANARRRAQEQYDWNRIVPQLLNRYGSLMASHQRAEFDAEGICATD